MLSQLVRTIRAEALIAPGDRVLVGLSGGPDSTALLLGLQHVAAGLTITLEAAVVDHGLRPASAPEAAETAQRCRALGIPCAVLRADVAAARGRHISTQDAARRARLGALEGLADEHACQRIALGHTADDQAETVLFRIVRGTGVKGLAGIPYRRGRFVRPLLDVRRTAILRFLRRREIPFVQDPSNEDPRFTRSRVRHDWLPRLAEENPRIAEALLALALDARRTTAGVPRPRPAIEGISRGAAAAIERLAAESRGTQIVSVKGGAVEIRYGQVAALRATTPAVPAAVEVRGGGVYRTTPGGPGLEIAFAESGVEGRAGVTAFDLDRLVLPVSVRPPQPGDRLRPCGGRGSRKVSDMLIDAKVPRPSRAFLPVLIDGAGTILYVPGLRPSEVALPGPETRHWLQVRAV